VIPIVDDAQSLDRLSLGRSRSSLAAGREALAVVAAVRAGHPTLRVDARLSALRLERLSA